MSLPVENFVSLEVSDYILKNQNLNNVDHLENGIVSLISSYILPMTQDKMGRLLNNEEKHALSAFVTGLSIYGYNYAMNQPESVNNIAKKSILAHILQYGYNKYK